MLPPELKTSEGSARLIRSVGSLGIDRPWPSHAPMTNSALSPALTLISSANHHACPTPGAGSGSDGRADTRGRHSMPIVSSDLPAWQLAARRTSAHESSEVSQHLTAFLKVFRCGPQRDICRWRWAARVDKPWKEEAAEAGWDLWGKRGATGVCCGLRRCRQEQKRRPEGVGCVDRKQV